MMPGKTVFVVQFFGPACLQSTQPKLDERIKLKNLLVYWSCCVIIWMDQLYIAE